MAEEFRFFLRTGLYVGAAGAVYWLVSYEPAGTALLVALLLAIVAFIWVGRASSRTFPPQDGDIGPLGWLNRVVGFTDDPTVSPPLQGGPDSVPLASGWPILAAGGATLAGLGLVFGAWLLAPGLLLLAGSLIGWMSQADPGQ